MKIYKTKKKYNSYFHLDITKKPRILCNMYRDRMSQVQKEKPQSHLN